MRVKETCVRKVYRKVCELFLADFARSAAYTVPLTSTNIRA
jgi:hypothetical protein